MSTNDDALRCADRLNGRFSRTYEIDGAAHIRRLVAENEALKTVMVAAAEEIKEHWDAHCDAEGYGPANLMRRLEECIPSEYGYTAGAFAKLKAENEAQAALLRQITLTAHCGGLASMSEAEALVAIRKLTLAHWAVLHCLGETEIRKHLEKVK